MVSIHMTGTIDSVVGLTCQTINLATSCRNDTLSDACRIPFAMRVESPLQSAPPQAVPVQTVCPRVSPGCRPYRRVGAAREAARQRPGCGGEYWGGQGRRGGMTSA